jgi:hypothetical protein|tara:strand:- start:3868 stop:4497 length:630 start_codon:yes stop_codon:yes gene_type:complete
MTITYPLTLPDTTSFKSVTLTARSTVGMSQSPFTYQQQFYKWSGETWEADVMLVPMKRVTAEVWISWLTSLRGMQGTFYMQPNPDSLTPQGSAGGTPTINGSHSAQSTTLSITGATASTTNWLKAGDFISILSGSSRQLLKVLTNSNTDSGGNVILDIYPALRSSLSGSEVITVNNATGIFRMASNDVNYNINQASLYGLGFTAIESIS